MGNALTVSDPRLFDQVSDIRVFPHRLKPENSVRERSMTACLLIASMAVLVFSGSVFAQDALAPPGQPLLTPSEIQALSAPQSSSGTGPEVSVNGRPAAETPRRFQYHFGITARGVYDDNIFISSFNRVDDYYFAIEPSLFLGFGTEGSGNSLSFVYRPSVFLFADNSQNDAIQHLIRLQGGHNFGKLALSASQDVQILDGADLNTLSDPTGHTANIDLGQRARHNIFTTNVGDSYVLTGKLFLSNSLGLTVDDYPSGAGISSKTFSGNLFLNYNYSPKFVIGVGGTGGYNTVEASSPDQTYEQANLRLTYTVTAKVSLNASGGIEFRQFGNDSRGTYVSPVYEIAASYQPFDGTAISLSGSRRTQNSASLGGQDFASTTINLALRQRFLRRFSLGFAVGYINSNYFSAVEGINATRDDNYYYIEPSIDLEITRFWSAGAYYLHRENSSSLDFFSFYDNQFGARTSLTF